MEIILCQVAIWASRIIRIPCRFSECRYADKLLGYKQMVTEIDITTTLNDDSSSGCSALRGFKISCLVVAIKANGENLGNFVYILYRVFSNDVIRNNT